VKKTLSGSALAAAVAVGLTGSANAADQLLSGAVASSSGQKLAGISVSAKADGSTITTTVYTDDQGAYYFPPLPAGKYKVWAQAITFETARSDVDLSAARKQNFTLATITDWQKQVRQLPGDMIYASLPGASEQDARLKTLVKNNCTGCHTLSYILQHRFDADGWYKVLDLMKNVNVSGINVAHERKVNGVIEQNQKELAAYLAHARGPGETSMKLNPRPRPSGEAARVVFTEYDVPLEETAVKRPMPDGSDWTLGSPSKFGELLHDSSPDLEGNFWFTINTPNHQGTVGRVDAKTGETKLFKVNGPRGLAANAHGMVRDAEGMIWFNANTGRGSLGRVDPKTQKVDVFVTPQNMAQTGGAVTLDVDPQGKVWVTSPNGALAFDPKAEKFSEFKSQTFKDPKTGANGVTYGLAADKDGNGWWLQMALDIVNKADYKTGKVTDLKLPPIKTELDRITDPEMLKFYENFAPLDFNTPVPWNQGPRRMGADKNSDDVWIGTSWGASLVRINTKTMNSSVVPLPYPGMSPYQITVDNNHNLWMNVWTSDVVLKYDPSANKWTTFDLPSRGTEVRHVSIDERNGKLRVVIPEYRVSKMAVMDFRSEADLAALKAQAER
jgi:streptogramin lyase